MAKPTWNILEGIHPGMEGELDCEVILIRHCESDSNWKLMHEGAKGCSKDAPLSKLGREQAKYVQEVIHKFKEGAHDGTEVRVSPCRRALETLGGPFPEHYIHKMLNERNYTEDFDTESGHTCRKETEAEFKERVGMFESNFSKLKGKTRHIIVGHSLFISEYINQVFGGHAAFTHLGNGSITIVHYTTAPDGTRRKEVQMIGSVDHIPPELRSGHHTALHYYTSTQPITEIISPPPLVGANTMMPPPSMNPK